MFEFHCESQSICFEMLKGIPTAIVALVVGLIAAAIAYRQYATAKAKLKFDLYNLRYEIFNLMWGFVSLVVQNDFSNQIKYKLKLHNLTHNVYFLFGNDISKYLDEITLKHNEMFPLAERLPNAEKITDEEYDRLEELRSWFKEEGENGMRKKFDKYLSFSKHN